MFPVLIPTPIEIECSLNLNSRIRSHISIAAIIASLGAFGNNAKVPSLIHISHKRLCSDYPHKFIYKSSMSSDAWSNKRQITINELKIFFRSERLCKGSERSKISLILRIMNT
jgi:hypothetical protein